MRAAKNAGTRGGLRTFSIRWESRRQTCYNSPPACCVGRRRASEMSPRIGYLLPTRERVMEGQPEAASLLALAERAVGMGFDSIWVGDSLLARPRHDPLTLL